MLQTIALYSSDVICIACSKKKLLHLQTSCGVLGLTLVGFSLHEPPLYESLPYDGLLGAHKNPTGFGEEHPHYVITFANDFGV